MMDEDEVLAFLDEERVMTCATFGPRGWPHLMPLWYVVRDKRLWAWTFAKSQKTKNIDVELVTDLGLEIFGRYGDGTDAGEYRDMVKAHAAKRVGLEFVEQTRATWDHRKLGNVY